jgi:hypothetical protein
LLRVGRPESASKIINPEGIGTRTLARSKRNVAPAGESPRAFKEEDVNRRTAIPIAPMRSKEDEKVFMSVGLNSIWDGAIFLAY